MAKNNRTCIICGHQYRYCGGCKDYAHLPVWMNIYHDENCKKIAEILRDFEAGEYDAVVAKAQLLECDLSVAQKQKYSFKSAYEKIFPVERTEEVKEEKIENNTAVEEVVEKVSNVEDRVDEDEVIISPNFKEASFKKYSKKRK